MPAFASARRYPLKRSCRVRVIENARDEGDALVAEPDQVLRGQHRALLDHPWAN